jgi:hypothetical protein
MTAKTFGLSAPQPCRVKIFREGGLTLCQNGEGRLIFRHAPLGLPPTYGHGHADALSVLLSWGDTPLLIDPGSGQYNGDQAIRDYFRSTIAHNTVELDGADQAEILGPFLWTQTYECRLNQATPEPWPIIEAEHSGYRERFQRVHRRRIEWPKPSRIEIEDTIVGARGGSFRAALHLGVCRLAQSHDNVVVAYFDNLKLRLRFDRDLDVQLLHGSRSPFGGWRTTVYGDWIPNYTVIFAPRAPNTRYVKTVLEILQA